MSTAENKLSLVQMIVESDDKTFISKVLKYASSLKKEKTTDWAEELPAEVFEELRLSIEEADNGTDPGIPHEVMLKKFRKKYPHLNL
ncbi:MAG: hypothetical protein ACO1N0_17085 [Fluviicola sp.]